MEVKALQQMLSQFRQVQETLEKRIDGLSVEASAGGGMVSVKMNGQKQLTEVRIEPDVFKSKDCLLYTSIATQTGDRWNFGLCATIPREPRQARKGATVAGQLRVPRITRSSSYRCRLAGISRPKTGSNELQSHRAKISPADVR